MLMKLKSQHQWRVMFYKYFSEDRQNVLQHEWRARCERQRLPST